MAVSDDDVFLVCGIDWCMCVINDALLLNQARASHRPARTWFLRTDPVWIIGMRVRVYACACVCVCPRPRLLITSGVIWRDMNLIRLVKQFLKLLYGNCSHYR